MMHDFSSFNFMWTYSVCACRQEHGGELGSTLGKLGTLGMREYIYSTGGNPPDTPHRYIFS